MSFSRDRPLATSSPKLCRRRLSFHTNTEHQVAHKLEYLQVDKTPSPILAPSPTPNYGGLRMVLDEDRIEQLKQLIDSFLRMHIHEEHQLLTPANTSTIRWTVNHDDVMYYNVCLDIHINHS